tara:strand:+ start:10461 stop:10967 length:507 start_codon:yes stop_codon:yes gene_type:complete
MTRLLIILLFTSSAIANIGNQKRFSIDIPSNWQMMKGFYGVPFTFLAPGSTATGRPTIQVIPSDQAEFKIDAKRMKYFDSKNKKGKEIWLKEHDGVLLKYEPMQEIKVGSQKMYITRSVYKVKSNTYDSKRYYTFCDGKFFEIRTMTNLVHKDAAIKNKKILESFQCK